MAEKKKSKKKAVKKKSEVEGKHMIKFLAVDEGKVVPVTILREGDVVDVKDKDIAKLVTLALQDLARHFRRQSATPPSPVIPHQAVGNPGGNECRMCRQKVTLDHGVWRGEDGKVGCKRGARG